MFDAIFDEFSSCYSYAKGPILCDDTMVKIFFFFEQRIIINKSIDSLIIIIIKFIIK